MSVIKLVDQSYKLGIHNNDFIIMNTREKLFEMMRQHLDQLFVNKSEEEKLFWATYTVYRVSKHGIYLCSRIGTGYPIYDVKVRKSHKTSITVKPYKVDGSCEYTITKLDLTITPEKHKKYISPLEVMGWAADLEQAWEGEIWVRTAFTGWNTIDVKVDKEKL